MKTRNWTYNVNVFKGKVKQYKELQLNAKLSTCNNHDLKKQQSVYQNSCSKGDIWQDYSFTTGPKASIIQIITQKPCAQTLLRLLRWATQRAESRN